MSAILPFRPKPGPNVTRALVKHERRHPRTKESPLLAVLGFVLVVLCIGMFGIAFAVIAQPLVPQARSAL